MDASKNSFVVSVLLRGEHTPPLPFEVQRWQELVIAVDGRDEAEARQRAIVLAKQNETEYVSVTGDQVRWLVEAIAGVWRLEEHLPDGTEVLSRFLRASEGMSLLRPFDD